MEKLDRIYSEKCGQLKREKKYVWMIHLIVSLKKNSTKVNLKSTLLKFTKTKRKFNTRTTTKS